MVRILELNTANYDDHPGWIDRLPFMVDTILGRPNGQNGVAPGGLDQNGIPNSADIICLSEIRYTANNSFYEYADTFWKLQGITRPPGSQDSMVDMIMLLLNKNDPHKRAWQNITMVAMEYSTDPVSWEGLSIITYLDIPEYGFFHMPPSNEPNPHTDRNKRITQWAVINVDNFGPLTVYNTHFATDPIDGAANAACVIDHINQVKNPTPFVVTGDLNAPPSDPCVQALLPICTDLWTEFNPSTDLGYTFAAPQLVKRIDYMLVSKDMSPGSDSNIQLIPPAGTEDGRSLGGTVFVSDHFGLWANLDIETTTVALHT